MYKDIKNLKTKEEIIQHTIISNAERQSKYADQIQLTGDMPLFSWVDINATELCTRKCKFCPRNDDNIYPNQNLNVQYDLVKKIAKELKSLEYKGGVIFSGYGEPLLHKDIVKLIDIFDRDIHVELVTNGDRLNAGLLRDLYSAGLGMIIVSMYDGPHQVDHFMEMFGKAGIAEDRYFLRNRWYSADDNFGLFLTNRGGTIGTDERKTDKCNAPCYYTSYFLLIDWNGDVLLCPQDWNKKIKFGNIHTQSLLDAWKSQNMAKYRKTLGGGSRDLYPCNLCNVKGTLHGYNHVKLWNKLYGGYK